MANSSGDSDFNALQFEKKLTNLKDSQESINKCCNWCLENRQHHKRIVTSWLTVLKRAKIEHRLTLFYLANDVIQYSKRRNFDFVDSWGTALQKATTMVRDEKIKNKILRIFKIWEQRGVYSEEFIADLCGLISASPAAKKNEEPHEFQSSYLITKVRNCAKLEQDTDNKLKKLQEMHPKKLEGESLCASLKQRAHVDDVEKEVDDYIKSMESYLNALKLEIKARNHIISLLIQAETQLNNDKKDVKLVANAYKTFASRVKHLKKKLDDLKPTLSSPIPSPDVNAPSPSPDSDIELPNTDSSSVSNYTQFSTTGFYTPITNTENSTFTNNGFSSFMGSNMPFDLNDINSTLFNKNQSNNMKPATTHSTYSYDANNTPSNVYGSHGNGQPQPVMPPGTASNDYQYTNVPLLPPPLPPFTKADNYDVGNTYSDSYNSNAETYGTTSYDGSTNPYEPSTPSYQIPVTSYQTSNMSSFQHSTSYPLSASASVPDYQTAVTTFTTNYSTTITQSVPYTSNEEYNPEEELETWDPEPNWDQPPTDLETPESPPIFEKKSYNKPIEYHDTQTHGTGVDVDQRVLPMIQKIPIVVDTDHGHRKKDVDHRNLITLTESPKDSSPKWEDNKVDKDYRIRLNLEDKDYRMFQESLKIPPPPPAIANSTTAKLSKKPHSHSPKKCQDNVESIDMELSDDDNVDGNNHTIVSTQHNKDNSFKDHVQTLEPPPPFPDMSEEGDPNALDNETSMEMQKNVWITQDELAAKQKPDNNYLSNLNELSWPSTSDRLWKDQKYQKENNNARSAIRNTSYVRNPSEFRGRPRGGSNWNYRGPGQFRHRGSPRPPPYSRGGLVRGRGFSRGNFRGSY